MVSVVVSQTSLCTHTVIDIKEEDRLFTVLRHDVVCVTDEIPRLRTMFFYATALTLVGLR
jgi:hypothetical protein